MKTGVPRGQLWFSPAVAVRSESNAGLTINVSNVSRAAETLLTWTKRGPKWRKAVQTCMDAMEGNKTPDEARKSFEAAAKESGMLRASL